MKNASRFPEGSIALVATPLGNQGDITIRAKEILELADLIAAEDTRVTARLLSSLGIKKPLLSYHDFNERQRAAELVERAKRGQRVAIVSDAGTPGISDPGFDAVRLARKEGLTVFPVPGPSAAMAFLCASGLPTDAFSFHGFLPEKSGRRRSFLEKLRQREETQVFYESPKRALSSLKDALEILGDRESCLGREMTKEYEEFLYGPLSSIIEKLSSREKILGEIVFGVRGWTGENYSSENEVEEALAAAIRSGAPLREASKELAARFNINAKEIYRLLNDRKSPE